MACHNPHEQIARDTASAIPISVPGTANSPWGGMGASGAQQTAEAFDDTLLDGNAAYAPLPAGKLIRNLTGDAFISGHGMRRFNGYITEEVPTVIFEDDEPDSWKDFVEHAKAAGASFVTRMAPSAGIRKLWTISP